MSGIVKYSELEALYSAAATTEVTGTSIWPITVDKDGTPTTKWMTGEVLKEVIRDEFGDNFLVGGTGITIVHDDGANTTTISVNGVLEDLDTLGAPSVDGQFIVATGAGAFAYESGATVRTSLGLGTSDNVTFNNVAANGTLGVTGAATFSSTVSATGNMSVAGTGAKQILVGSTNTLGATLILDGSGNGDGAGGDYAFFAHEAGGDLHISNLDGGIEFATGASDVNRLVITSGGQVQVGAGGLLVDSDLTLASGSITSASGAISFGNENITTTGTLAAGATTVSGSNPALTISDTQQKAWVNGDKVGRLVFRTEDVSGIGAHETAYIEVLNDASSTTPTGNLIFGASANNAAASEIMRLTSTGASITGTLDVSSDVDFDSGGLYWDQSAAALILGSTSTSSNAQFYATKTYSAGTNYAVYSNPSISAGSELDAVVGKVSVTATSGTVGYGIGVQGFFSGSGSGGATTYGAALWATHDVATGHTVTNAYSLYLSAKTGGGTRINDWSIYSADTAASYLAGSLHIGTTSAAGNELLRVNGLIHSDSDSIIIDTAKTPASAAATGTQGQIAWDANYVYVCTATDTWKRAAISTWV